jgi:hypothetical protein
VHAGGTTGAGGIGTENIHQSNSPVDIIPIKITKKFAILNGSAKIKRISENTMFISPCSIFTMNSISY